MATVAVQQVLFAGTTRSVTAASASGDKFEPGDTTCLGIFNLSGGSITVTIATTRTSIAGLAITDVVIVVPSLSTRIVGPFPREHFAGSDGLVAVTYSAHSLLGISPFKL